MELTGCTGTEMTALSMRLQITWNKQVKHFSKKYSCVIFDRSALNKY
jgi:hypothetical protein